MSDFSGSVCQTVEGRLVKNTSEGEIPVCRHVSCLSADARRAIRGQWADTCSYPQSNELWEKWRCRQWEEKMALSCSRAEDSESRTHQQSFVCVTPSCFIFQKALFGSLSSWFYSFSLFP